MRPCWLALLWCCACSTYVQHRAALVPRAVPVQTLGQPAAWNATASFGASNIDLGSPSSGDPDAGIAVPTKQVRASLGFAITRELTVSVFREHGLASSAQPLEATLPALENEPVYGHGYTVSYSIATGTPLRIGLTGEMVVWRVPWVEYSTCIENCSMSSGRSSGTTDVPSMALGIVPSYRLGAWTWFGGITGRTHPTLDARVVNHGLDPIVQTGPFNAVVHGGVAYEAGELIQFVVDLHHVVTADPVAYAPGIGLTFVLGLSRRNSKVEPPPTILVPVAAGDDWRYDEAVGLTDWARTQAMRRECDSVRGLSVRVRALDAEYHATVFMRDVLIASCLQ
ncbi:MAG TPA: hypothetical protein VIV11_10080 [Kofleriaceae bacterium]